MEDAPRLTRARHAAIRYARAAIPVALVVAACGEPPAPRGRYALASVDGQPVPITASFYTPAVGYRADLVGGDLLVCAPTFWVRTDRVREHNTAVPTDDPRAAPTESWHTAPLAVRRTGRALLLAHADTTAASADLPLDSGTVSGPAGDSIAVDAHDARVAGGTHRYLFVRAPADTIEQAHPGTLCAGYARPTR